MYIYTCIFTPIYSAGLNGVCMIITVYIEQTDRWTWANVSPFDGAGPAIIHFSSFSPFTDLCFVCKCVCVCTVEGERKCNFSSRHIIAVLFLVFVGLSTACLHFDFSAAHGLETSSNTNVSTSKHNSFFATISMYICHKYQCTNLYNVRHWVFSKIADLDRYNIAYCR